MFFVEWILLKHSREEQSMESRLKKYIASLSEEERTLYKPLIEDALRRDQALSLTLAEARENVAMYEYQMERLGEATRQFHAGILRLNGNLEKLAELSESAFAKSPGGTADGGYSKLRH